MANDALAQLVETQTAMERLLGALRLEKEHYTFNPEEERSLLRSIQFEEYFLDIIEKVLQDFESNKSGVLSYRLDMLEQFSKVESITKEHTREFFNLLIKKLSERDKLYNAIPELKNFPEFVVGNLPNTTSADHSSIVYLQKVIIPKLRELHRSLIEADRQAKTADDQKTEIEVKKETGRDVDSSYVGSTGAFRQRGTNPSSTAGTAESTSNDSSPTPSDIDIQKLAAQEGWRDSSALMDNVLNSALSVDNWRKYYNELTPDEQRQLDFQLYSLQEDVAGAISLYLQDNPRFALLLSQSSQLSVTERIKIREQLLSLVGEIYKRLCTNEYFLLKTELLKDKFGLKGFQNTSFKGSLKTAQDATKLFAENLDQEEAKKEYSVLQQNEFKRQLKQIATLNSLSSSESIEELAKQILQRSPLAKGTGISALDPVELRNIFPENLFSLGADERQQLLKQIDTYLREMQLDGRTVNDANYDSFAKFERFNKDNPKAALISLLRAYKKDGVTERNILNTLDSYALSLGSPHLISENLHSLLNAIDPDIKNNHEVLRILESYVVARKHTLASYTNNNLLTYSFEPGDTAPVVLSTEQYREMIKLYSQKYQDNTDKILAHAFYTRELAIIPADISEQERLYREEALKVRNEYLSQIKTQIEQLSREQQIYYSNLLGVDRQQFFVNAQSENDQAAQAQFNNALYETAQQYQAWNAPKVGIDEGSSQGLGSLHSWLGKARGLGKFNIQSLKGVATKLASAPVRKAVLVGAGAAGAGVVVYSLLQNLIGTVGAMAAGGATTGAIIGGVFFGLPGAIIGGAIGGIGGLILGYVHVNGGSVTASLAHTASASKAAFQNIADPIASQAADGAKSLMNVSAQTLTTATANIATNTTIVAVATPLIAVSVLSVFTITVIMGAFLPDASTVQVAPYFSLDIEESQYITLKKTAQPSNAAAPGSIAYTIDVAPKPQPAAGGPITVVITSLTDTMSAIDKDSNTIDPPTVPQEVIDQLNSYAGKTLTADQPIHIEFTVDASDPRFQDSLVKNDIKVKIKANDIDDEANARAQTCFGDCPKTVLPACWPTLGSAWQPPCARGTRANPVYNPNASYSHRPGSACLDAYDVGARLGTPIFSMAPGTVIFAQIDPRTATNPGSGYGNLIKIDHGGFVLFYAHLDRFAVSSGDPVDGGQLIGYVGHNGFSSGPHLHFEVVGLQDFLFQDLFGISGKSVPTNGPRCDEYYGNAQ